MNIKPDATLDMLYNKKLKYFHNKFESTIPKLKLKIDELNSQKNKDNEEETNQKIEQLQKKIKQIVDERDRYFLDNSKYLFEYFESKQNIDKNNNPKKKINNFFKINSYTINDNMYTMTTSCADKIYTVEVELKACFENCTN